MKAAAAALAALLGVLVPVTAQAAPYDVQLCAEPTDAGFVASANTPAIAMSVACPATDSDPYSGVFVGVKPAAVPVPGGAAAGWTLSAPAGLTFREIEVRRRLLKTDRDYEILVKADDRVVDGCGAGVRCGEETFTRTYELRRKLEASVRCAEAACSASGPNAWLAVRSAKVTIDDPAPPTVPAPAGRWQRPTDVTVSATDASGVASLELRTGDRVLGTASLACDYRRLRPCPETGTAAIAAADLADGIHPVSVKATDAAGQAASATGTLKLDRTAPGSPENLTVRALAGGMYAYAWTNPDQGANAPIAAARLSDGTVVRGANLQALESASPVERIHLEDEAGNADPATAVAAPTSTRLQLKPPILQSAPPRIKLSSARRSGTRLIVKGTVANATSARITATVKRGKRTARKTATVKRGRFTIRIALNSKLRRTGTVSLTVKHGTAKATRRVRL